jgi:hypothetical protein
MKTVTMPMDEYNEMVEKIKEYHEKEQILVVVFEHYSYGGKLSDYHCSKRYKTTGEAAEAFRRQLDKEESANFMRMIREKKEYEKYKAIIPEDHDDWS